MNGNITLAYTSPYDNEVANNNMKALEVLSTMYPGLFEPTRIELFGQVEQGINLVLGATGNGQVIVHIRNSELNVEFRGNYISKSD